MARNRTPSSTEEVSGSVRSGTAVAAQIVHGQLLVLAAAVVKLQLAGSMTLPAVSAASLMVAV